MKSSIIFFYDLFICLQFVILELCGLKNLHTLVDEQTLDNDAPQVSNVMLIVDKFGKQKSWSFEIFCLAATHLNAFFYFFRTIA